jgi:hypothetical protein
VAELSAPEVVRVGLLQAAGATRPGDTRVRSAGAPAAGSSDVSDRATRAPGRSSCAVEHAAERIAVGVQARAAQPERASASAPGAEEAPAGADACCQLSLTPTPALAARTAEQRPPASEASALVRSSTAAGTDALLLDTCAHAILR